MDVKTTVIVRTKSGNKLFYEADGTVPDVKARWLDYLSTNSTGSLCFGRFIIPKSEVDYVEVLS